jgi:hypothetical protein
MRMVSGCLWYARSDERSRPQTPRLTRAKKAPQEATALWSTSRTLLHGYADVIQIHVSQVPVAVLMIVEVHADRLPLVSGQILRHLCPCSSV